MATRLDVPFALDYARLGSALAAAAPWCRVEPKGSGWRIVDGDTRHRVKAKPRGPGTRLTITTESPWWVWLFLLVGLLAVVIAVLVYEGSKGSDRERLRYGLWAVLSGAAGAAPGAAARVAPAVAPPMAPAAPVSCPFCRASVVPLLDATGRRVCPACRNMGRASPPVAAAR